MRSLHKRIGAVFCMVGVLLMLIGSVTLGMVHAEGGTKLTLIAREDSKKFVANGMEWNLYRVATFDYEEGTLTLDGNFANYKVYLGDMSASALTDAASTLKNYAVTDKIKPDYTGYTDANGTMVVNNLRDGFYLALGKKMKQGEFTFEPIPMLFTAASDLEPEITIHAKIKTKVTMADVEEIYKVKKIWENAEDQPEKPVTITVGLYEEGELVETIELNEANDWTYEWTVYNDNEWLVKELEVPNGCSVIYRDNEIDFVVVNTYGLIVPEETTQPTTTTRSGIVGDGSDTGTETSVFTTHLPGEDSNTTTTVTESASTAPKSTVSTASTSPTTTTTENKLPQTGQLWWPVPIMILLGLIFMGVGARMLTTSKREDS